jgi:APA family basic amino acid/polyamine antiporter
MGTVSGATVHSSHMVTFDSAKFNARFFLPFSLHCHFMSASSSPSPGLVRVLGPVMATAIVVGTVIGSGVFKKPHAIARAVPESGLVALVWILGGVLVLLGALAYAEVAVLFPRAGGNYVFLREGYGRLAGFLWGWVEFWIIRSASLAALATVFTESLNDVFGNESFQQLFGLRVGTHLDFWGQRIITVSVLLGLALVNIRGTTWGGGLQVAITLVKVGSLIGIALLPFVLLARSAPTPGGATPSISNLQPVWPPGGAISLSGLGSALLGVLWAYHGWMNIAPVAEEVRRPQRNIPLALLLGVGTIITLYLSANLAYYLTMPGQAMASEAMKETPVATAFARNLLGPIGVLLASATIMCSVFGALNGNLLVGPRVLYAMGEDGLAPRVLRDVHPRYQTPAAAIAVLAGWAVLLVLAVAVLTQVGALDPTKSHFDRLTDFAMFGAVIFETLAVLSIFRFRRLFPDAERPYRCPGYPFVPALYCVVPAFVLCNMFVAEPVEALAGLGFIAAGAVAYFALGLARTAPGLGLPKVDLSPAPRVPEPTGIAPPEDKVAR